MELDRARAAATQPYFASTITTGNEPLIVDWIPPQSSTVGEHWIVFNASLKANLTAKQPNTSTAFPPLTGLFLVPIGTEVETLAQSAAGWNMNARTILLPLGPPGAAVATIAAGPPYAFALTLATVSGPLTVPYGWMLRAIVVCDAGNAAPGPGALSNGILTVFAMRERDKDPEVCL